MDIKLANGTNIFLQYEQFKVASAKDKYKLTVGGFQGTTTDPMVRHNGMYFTTKDSDNDKSSVNCAMISFTKSRGGWWYNSCWCINFNHHFNTDSYIYFNNQRISKAPTFIEMKIRPLNCNI